MNKAFDAALDFDERTVRKELGDLTLDLLADRVFALDVFPWVFGHLLEAERNPLFLAIHVENDDIDGLADVEQLGRMVDAAPRHVGNVEQAIHAGEIDEGAEIGEVLDRTDHLVADLDGLQERLALLGALGFDDFAAGKDDVFALVVDLDDLEFVDVSNEFGKILGWDDVHLGAGEESLDTDVDGETAFDNCLDLTTDKSAILVNFDDLVPVLFVGGLFLGKDDHALVVLKTLKKDFDLIADFDILVLELVGRNRTLGFVADVHEDDLRADFEDGAFHDGSFTELHEFRIDEVTQLLVNWFCGGSTHIYWLVVWLVWFRFPSDNCPGKKRPTGTGAPTASRTKEKRRANLWVSPRFASPKKYKKLLQCNS